MGVGLVDGLAARAGVRVEVGLGAGVGRDTVVAAGLGLIQLIGDLTQIRVAVWSALASIMRPGWVNWPVFGS